MIVDVIVLGSGIIGVSTALHLQQRGRLVGLLDRRGVAMEASFGNAGIIQREAVFPYAFPQGIGALLRYARNRNIDVRYDRRALVQLAPFLWHYWRHSRPLQHEQIAHRYSTLIQHCVAETRFLAEHAGVGVLLKRSGWVKVFRNGNDLETAINEAARWHDEYGINFKPLDSSALRIAEPSLGSSLTGGLHFLDADTVTDPGALVTGYCRRFETLGGQFMIGDATSLRQIDGGWRVLTETGPLEAPAAVVALGAWSGQLAKRLGYSLRLAAKRGYHMHYAVTDGASLKQPVLDAAGGYVLAPMTRGVRLTTGVEFAPMNAAKTPLQLQRAEVMARSMFPLGEALDAEPWMGLRPCTPDMLPVIGPATRHAGLWFAFGHAHHGLTLGGVTGRLIAEMITGTDTLVDPAPFRVDRPALQG